MSLQDGSHSLDPRASEDVSACLRAYESEFAYVYRALRRHGVAGPDVEDLAQDVFMIMWRRWGDYDRLRPLRPWLAGIALRVAQGYLRRRRREIPHPEIDAEASGPDGEQVLSSTRNRTLALRALAAVREDQRALLVSHDIDDLSVREIARALGIPLFTAYTRLRNARKAFARVVRDLEGRAPAASTVRISPAALLAAEKLVPPPPEAAQHHARQRARAVAFAPGPGGMRQTRTRSASGGVSTKWTWAAAGLALGLASVLGLRLHSSQLADPQVAASRGPDLSPRARWSLTTLVNAGARLRPAFVPAPHQGPFEEAAAGNPTPVVDLARGIVGYWRLDDGPGSVTTHDLSASQNHCLIRNVDATSGWIDSPQETALNLAGRGWLECPHVATLDTGATELSISLWMRRVRPERQWVTLVSRQLEHARLDCWFLGIETGSLRFSSDLWKVPALSPLPPASGAWEHVAAVHRDGQSSLFLNGTEVANVNTGDSPMRACSSPVTIGGSVNGPDTADVTERFGGSLDEVVLYGRALSAREVAALAAGAQPAL